MVLFIKALLLMEKKMVLENILILLKIVLKKIFYLKMMKLLNSKKNF